MKPLFAFAFTLILSAFATPALAQYNQNGQLTGTAELGQYCDNVAFLCDASQGLTCDLNVGTAYQTCVFSSTVGSIPSASQVTNSASCSSNPSICPTGTTCSASLGQCVATQAPAPAAPVAQPTAPNTSVGQPTAPNTTSSGGLLNPLSAGTSLQSFLTSILSFVIKIGAVVVVLMLVYVGFLFATAGGDASQISKAREALLWTLVGALILLGAQGIATAIQATTAALSAGT